MILYKDLINDFLAVCSKIDFWEFYKANPMNFVPALLFISNHIGKFGDKNLLDYFINELIKVAERITNELIVNPEQNIIEEILIFLIDAAYKISLHQDDRQKASLFFSDIVEKLFKASPSLAKKYRGGLWYMVTQLPIDQLHGIWKLFLISRAY